MTDLISRAELFNKLSRIPIHAIEERTEIYKVINGMKTHKACDDCDGFLYDYCSECPFGGDKE